MRRTTFFVLFVLCFVIVIVSFGCLSLRTNDKIEASVALNSVSYEITTAYNKKTLDNEFINRLNNAQAKMYELFSEEEKENYCVSPISIYMALSLLDFVGDEKVKEDISSLLGLSEEDILMTKELFDFLVRENRVFTGKGEERKVVGLLDMTNSIWVDNDITPEEETLNALAEKFYCYAYKTPFSSDIVKANKDIRVFIKDKTRGLIDKDFDLDSDTIFALINTLYFKDNWNDEGNDLLVENKEFYTKDGKITCEYLLAPYIGGQVYSDELSESFYTETTSKFRIVFVMPKDNVSIKEVMNGNHINIINSKIFNTDGDVATRLIFPRFKVECETKVKDILEKKGYLSQTFACFKSNLIEDPLFVSDIKHNVSLNVDKKGIEGAAVTIIAMDKNSGPLFAKEYQDFIINKEFGFYVMIDNVILFMGQITNPLK